MAWTFPTAPAAAQRDYNHLLAAAHAARPTPNISGFPVRGAAMSLEGHILAAGNHEHGLGHAEHCEQSLFTQAREMDAQMRLQAIGFLHDGNPIYPCGNCRDVLREIVTPDAVIVNAPYDGGEGTVLPFERLLYTPTSTLDLHNASAVLRKAIAIAERYRKAANLTHLPADAREKVYGAATVSETGAITGAGHVGGGAYTATDAVWNALVKAEDHAPIRTVVVAAPGTPDMTYKDRQRLVEFVADRNGERDIAVLVVQTSPRRHAWRAMASQFLPYAFVLRNG